MKRIISNVFMASAVLLMLPLLSAPSARAAEAGAQFDMNVKINPTISITLDNTSIDLDLAPTIHGASVTGSSNVNVSTNNLTGYTLTMSTTGQETALIQQDITDKISATASAATTANLVSNTWGYSLSSGDSATYSAVPSVDAPITLNTSETPVSDAITPVSFAVKADTSIASGIYSGSVLFSAVTNYVPPVFNGITTMQEMTGAICDAETTPSKTATETTDIHRDSTDLVPEATLIDTRDNNTYTVRKLADGNCWMVDNLRLVGSKTLTPADSDVSSNWTIPSASTFERDDYTAYITTYNDESSQNSNVYYNWTAATAGTGDDSFKVDGDAPSSVCPKGWSLPSYESHQTNNRSFQHLMDTYNIQDNASGAAILATQPLQFSKSGSYDGFDYDVGMNGYYWSSTSNLDDYADYLYFNTQRALRLSYNRYHGYSVRCVARPDLSVEFKAAYQNSGKTQQNGYYRMQDMSSSICNTVPTPEAFSGGQINANVPEIKLIDSRDGETYTVRKLADGKCWMTDNLRYVKEDMLVSDTTDRANDIWFHGTERYEQDLYSNYSSGYSIKPRTESAYGNGAYYSSNDAVLGMRANDGGSICPAGWTLPSRYPNVDFGIYTNQYGYIEGLFGVYQIGENNFISRQQYETLTRPPFNFTSTGYYSVTDEYSQEPKFHFNNSEAITLWTGLFNYYSDHVFLTISPDTSYYDESGYQTNWFESTLLNAYQIRCIARE